MEKDINNDEQFEEIEDIEGIEEIEELDAQDYEDEFCPEETVDLTEDEEEVSGGGTTIHKTTRINATVIAGGHPRSIRIPLQRKRLEITVC